LKPPTLIFTAEAGGAGASTTWSFDPGCDTEPAGGGVGALEETGWLVLPPPPPPPPQAARSTERIAAIERVFMDA
jgi:hypothetical protein